VHTSMQTWHILKGTQKPPAIVSTSTQAASPTGQAAVATPGESTQLRLIIPHTMLLQLDSRYCEAACGKLEIVVHASSVPGPASQVLLLQQDGFTPSARSPYQLTPAGQQTGTQVDQAVACRRHRHLDSKCCLLKRVQLFVSEVIIST